MLPMALEFKSGFVFDLQSVESIFSLHSCLTTFLGPNPCLHPHLRGATRLDVGKAKIESVLCRTNVRPRSDCRAIDWAVIGGQWCSDNRSPTKKNPSDTESNLNQELACLYERAWRPRACHHSVRRSTLVFIESDS
jgi:hypothetical protein